MSLTESISGRIDTDPNYAERADFQALRAFFSNAITKETQAEPDPTQHSPRNFRYLRIAFPALLAERESLIRRIKAGKSDADIVADITRQAAWHRMIAEQYEELIKPAPNSLIYSGKISDDGKEAT